MNTKTFLKLVVLLAALIGLAYWLNRPAGKVTIQGVASGDAVLPGLDVNAVTRIEIASASSTSVLARTESGWVSESLFGYPATFDRIAGALRALSDLTAGQVMRDGVENPADFGLVPGDTAADLHTVRLVSSDGKTTELTLGALKQMRDASSMGIGIPTGRYLRVGDGPVLLVEEMLSTVVSTPAEWVDRNLIALPADQITSVSIIGTNDEFTIRRNDEDLFDIGRVEEGASVDQSAVLRVLQAFQSLQFDTVIDPALAGEAIGMDRHEQVTVRTREAIEYTLTIGAPGEGEATRMVRISAAWKPEGEPGEEKATREEEVAKKNELFGQWTYRLPVGVVNQILATRDSLVTRPSPPPPTTPPVETTAPVAP